jgi:four helix bundle protein
MSKQLLRSGTSIGANIREAEHGQSKADFISKLSISLNEANESDYWLELLSKSNYIIESEYFSLKSDIDEFLKLFISIINTSKINNNG